MEKKYTEEDLIELEKIHRDNYLQIFNLANNILYKTKEDHTREMIINILNVVYQKAVFSQKDINISEKAIKRSATSTNKNTSNI